MRHRPKIRISVSQSTDANAIKVSIPWDRDEARAVGEEWRGVMRLCRDVRIVDRAVGVRVWIVMSCMIPAFSGSGLEEREEEVEVERSRKPDTRR